jgi:hypothetical protein
MCARRWFLILGFMLISKCGLSSFTMLSAAATSLPLRELAAECGEGPSFSFSLSRRSVHATPADGTARGCTPSSYAQSLSVHLGAVVEPHVGVFASSAAAMPLKDSLIWPDAPATCGATLADLMQLEFGQHPACGCGVAAYVKAAGCAFIAGHGAPTLPSS